MLRRLQRLMRAIVPSGRAETEMDREIRFHIECETEKNLRRGMSESDARRSALISFGGVEQFKEECRDANRPRWIESFGQDMRYAVRILRKDPGFTLVALLTLALGIGVNTAIFSVIYGVLIRPLPFKDGDRMIVVKQRAPIAGLENVPFSVKEIADYREQNRTMEGMVEHHSMTFTLLGGAEPELIQTGVVSHNFFEMLGVQPLIGRTFVPGDEEHGAEAVLILSYDYWKRSHQGDRGIVGRVFAMNNRPHTVVGVLPSFPQFPNENDVYMPTSACPARSSEQFRENRNARMMTVFGKLRQDVPLELAKADLSAVADRLRQAYPESYPAERGYAVGLTTLYDVLTQNAKRTFLILLGTAGLVLLAVCANVANLMLSRIMRREREMTVRAALGASRGRLVRQMLTESLLLALLGGALGLLLASITLNLLSEFAAKFTPRAAEISLDSSVLLFTFLVSVGTGIAFGLMPAIASKSDLVTSLKETGSATTTAGGSRRARGALVTAQVAVSFLLLVGAGLMVRSLLKLQSVSPGFDPEKVLVMRLSPNWSRYTTPEQYQKFSMRVLEKMKGQPGVLTAAMASNYPLNPLGISSGPFSREFEIEGRAHEQGQTRPRADFRVVSQDYFETIRLPLIKGRVFERTDGIETPSVAVINQSMARHRWKDEDPIGRRVSFDSGRTWVTIVGIVGDAKHYGLSSESTDEFYRPLEQGLGGSQYLLLRTTVAPTSIVRQTRDAVYSLDPDTAIDHVRTLEDVRNESLSSPRLMTILLGLFAMLALVITCAGIAGVMALSVTERTHEVGIRMALGATRGKLIWMEVRRGLPLVIAGLVLGSISAVLLSKLMSTLLFDVEPTDPITFLSVAVALAAVAAVACLVPVRRVTSIDPLKALRSE